MARALFPESTEFRSSHVAIFTFVHGAATAIWNTRANVAGYLFAAPEATNADLLNRFVTGTGIHGASIRETFVVQSWEAQREELARMALINTLAVYEGWTDRISARFGRKTFARELQFPSRNAYGSTTRGVRDALADMSARQSAAMQHEVTPRLKHQNRNAFRANEVDELLAIYRYFKELRNSEIHEGGRASGRLVDAYDQIDGLSSRAIGMKEIPEAAQPTLGKRTPISLRGVLGFGGVVHRMVATVDVLLSGTTAAENAFADEMRDAFASVELPDANPLRARKIRGVIQRCGFPDLDPVSEVEAFLTERGIIG